MKTAPSIGARVVLSQAAIARMQKQRPRDFAMAGTVIGHAPVPDKRAGAGGTSVKAVVQWDRPVYTEHLLPEFLELVP